MSNEALSSGRAWNAEPCAADPAITLALYSWALPGDKRETIGLLDAHLGEITA